MTIISTRRIRCTLSETFYLWKSSICCLWSLLLTSSVWRYCNGGDLSDLIREHQERNLAIPEHFIW